MTEKIDGMTWLSQWYKSNCDGEWEHAEGVTIVTLDNPGWHILVSLSGTKLENKNFTDVSHGVMAEDIEDDPDWYIARISDAAETRELGGRCFMAYCGPTNFNKVIDVFRAFAEDHGK